jgi:hypothetical protein
MTTVPYIKAFRYLIKLLLYILNLDLIKENYIV